MKPFFSIIIPTLNEELFLPYLLNNLAEQKAKNFEVIIVDANSSDNTQNIAKSFKKKLNLKLYITNKGNVSFQKNFGASKAHGKYLIFTDADCKVNSAFTKKFEATILQKKGLIFFPYIIPEEKTKQMKVIYQFLNFMIDISQNTKKPFPSIGCMCYEKNLFNLIKGFDEKILLQEDFNIAKKSREWGIIGLHLSNVSFTFSFRKIKKEGQIKSLYKLFVGSFHYMSDGDTKKKIFDNDMGGHLYNEKEMKVRKSKLVNLDSKKIKAYFRELFLDTKS